VLGRDQRLLEENRTQLGIIDLKIVPHPQYPDVPQQARLRIGLEKGMFDLLIKCPDTYPEQPPLVMVEQDNQKIPFKNWVWRGKDSSLAEIALSALVQVAMQA
jgi:hypothetical protein